jgi:hypothetical protein
MTYSLFVHGDEVIFQDQRAMVVDDLSYTDAMTLEKVQLFVLDIGDETGDPIIASGSELRPDRSCIGPR